MIKRLSGFACFLAVLCLSAAGQNTSTFGRIMSGAAQCQSANCVYYQLPPGTPWVVVTVSGTWSGTINLASISAPNANYSNLNSVAWNQLATTTTNGTWSVATGGATFLLVESPSWSSGSASVTMTGSFSGSPLNNPVFPGIVTGGVGNFGSLQSFNPFYPGVTANTMLPGPWNGARPIPGLTASSSCATNDPNAAANTAALNAAFSQPFTSWFLPAGIYAVNTNSGGNPYVLIETNGIKLFGGIPTAFSNGSIGGPLASTLCNQTESTSGITIFAPTVALEPAPTIQGIYIEDAGGANPNPGISATGAFSGNADGDFLKIEDVNSDGFAGAVFTAGYSNMTIDGIHGHAGSATSGNFFVDTNGNSNYIGKISGDCAPSGNSPAIPGLLRIRAGVGTVAMVSGDSGTCPDHGQVGTAFPITSTSTTFAAGTTTITIAAVNDAALVGMSVGGVIRLAELRNTPVSSWNAPNTVQCTIASITASTLTCTVSGEPSGVPYATTNEPAAWAVDFSINTGARVAAFNIADDEWDTVLTTSASMVQGVVGSATSVNWFTSGIGSTQGSLWDSSFINAFGNATIYSASQPGVPLQSTGSVSNVACSSGTCTVTVNNGFTAGQYSYCNNLTSATWLNFSGGGPYFQIATASSTQFTFSNSKVYSASESSGHCFVGYPFAHDLSNSATTKIIGPMLTNAQARTPGDLIWGPDKTLHAPEQGGQYVPDALINTTNMPAGPVWGDYLRIYYDNNGFSHRDASCNLPSMLWTWCPMINYGTVTDTVSGAVNISMLPYSGIIMNCASACTLTLTSQPWPGWCADISTVNATHTATLVLGGGITYLGGSSLPALGNTPIHICADPTSSTNFIGPPAAYGITVGSSIVAGGTQSIAGTCNETSPIGGASAGSFTTTSTTSCTIIITPGNATANGFICGATDITGSVKFTQTGYTTTTCTLTGTPGASGDRIVWNADTAF